MEEYMESELQLSSKMVLLVEHQEDNQSKKVDLRFFIIYDPNFKKFIVFGRRFSNPLDNSPPFSFNFKSSQDLQCFLSASIGLGQEFGLTLYNFNNLVGMNPNEFTFELFESLMDRLYEIAGYDLLKMKHQQNRDLLCCFLKTLKTTATF